MAGRIYLLNENSGLMAMEEAPYDSEKLLQEMLAKHPDLLAGEQIDTDEPRRWLLVTGHPASTHFFNDSKLHRTARPIRIGSGILPVFCMVHKVFSETLSSFAAWWESIRGPWPAGGASPSTFTYRDPGWLRSYGPSAALMAGARI